MGAFFLSRDVEGGGPRVPSRAGASYTMRCERACCCWGVHWECMRAHALSESSWARVQVPSIPTVMRETPMRNLFSPGAMQREVKARLDWSLGGCPLSPGGAPVQPGHRAAPLVAKVAPSDVDGALS